MIQGSISAARTWFSADDLAALALPGLPRSKRHINERAREERWALKVDDDGAPLARRRAGRGGGIEYHVSVLPAAARVALAGSGMVLDGVAEQHPIAANDEVASPAWQWFDRQTEKVKAEGRRRLVIVTNICDLEAAGLSRSAAVAEIASEHDVSTSTLWSWLRLIAGLNQTDWLPALAPQRKGGGCEADVDAEIWTVFKSDYLRLEKPTLSSCYRRAESLAISRGVAIPIMKTFQRKLEREVDPRVIILLRDGNEALRRSMPPQRRTVSALHAMELVNIDGHKFDVFARDGDVVFRPMMIAIQDVMSRKILAWRIGEVESAIQTRLTFADLFRNWGIPKGCLLDNGRAFASKWITGGALTRFRFKIREEDPTGLLPALGINPHWATPYRGQSKPIERGFRDLCDTVARHPAMAGAYTGNSPAAKPENHGSRAIPIKEFRAHVAEGIAAHNAQRGRRTEMGNGRSFDDVFAESYASAPIGKATPEQLRLALLAGENRRVDRRTGAIEMLGNRYWTDELRDHYGQIVTVRFDPDDLHQPIHVYDLAGRYICSPDIIEDTGFQDVAAAKARGRQEANWRRATREAEAMEQLLTAAEVAARLPRQVPTEVPEARIVRPVRPARRGGAAVRLVTQHDEAELMNDFSSALRRLRVVED